MSSSLAQRRKNSLAMPQRTDISSILVIDASPIVIGQARKVDYLGTQAITPATD